MARLSVDLGEDEHFKLRLVSFKTGIPMSKLIVLFIIDKLKDLNQENITKLSKRELIELLNIDIEKAKFL